MTRPGYTGGALKGWRAADDKITCVHADGLYVSALDERAGETPLESLLERSDQARGKALATMRHWVVRRVESVHLQDAATATRALTVDFIVPRGLAGGAPDHLPLVLLRKLPPVMNLDLLNSDGSSLPLLTRRENAALSAAALRSALLFVAGSAATEHLDQCDLIAFGAPADAGREVGRLALSIRALPAADSEEAKYASALRVRRLMLVAKAMAGNSLIWVPNADPPGTRKIVKFAYDGQIERLSSLPVRFGVFFGFRSLHVGFATPHLRACQSYHFECQLPEGLEMHGEHLAADIREDQNPEAAREPEFFKAAGRDLHLYVNLRGTYTTECDLVSFKVRPGRQGLLSFALIAATLIAAMLWTGVALQDRLEANAASQALPPVLLLVPVILLALIIRPAEHPFSALLLTGTRYLVLGSGVVATTAAGALGFVAEPSESSSLLTVWFISAVLATLIATTLLVGWIASLPRRGRAASWGIVLGTWAVALALWASLTSHWGPWTIDLAILAAVVAAVCARIYRQGRPVPPPARRYFYEDLRASGVLPPDE